MRCGRQVHFTESGCAQLGELTLQLPGSAKTSQQPALERVGLVERRGNVDSVVSAHTATQCRAIGGLEAVDFGVLVCQMLSPRGVALTRLGCAKRGAKRHHLTRQGQGCRRARSWFQQRWNTIINLRRP